MEFSKLMDQLPLMVRACSINAEIKHFNPASEAFAAEFDSWSAVIHADDRSVAELKYAQHLELQTPFNIKYRYITHGGGAGWLADQLVPWYSHEGVFLGFVGYAIAIDEPMSSPVLHTKNTAEGGQLLNEELQRSQDNLIEVTNNLNQIINMLPASVVVIRGHDLVVELINTTNLLYWDKSKEEVLGRRFLDILPDLADQPFAGQLRHVMETGETLSVVESPVIFTNPDGSSRETYVDYTYQPLSDLEGNRTGVLVMSFEITERVLSKRRLEELAEELETANTSLMVRNDELARSEVRFKYLIQEAPIAIAVLQHRELIIESANAKVLQLWGNSAAVIGLPLSEALPELQGQPFLRILDQVYTSGQPFYANEIPALLAHAGELKEIFFNVTYQPIADITGSTPDILVVAVDVTEQVNARKQVEQSEQHFRYLADLVPAKISNALPTGEVTFFNQQWLDFAGMGFEELRDFGYHQMMHPEEIPAFQTGLAAAAATGLPHVSQMRFKNIHGKYIWHLNIASPILDEQGQIKMWVGSTTDIDILKLEEQRKDDFVSMQPRVKNTGYLN